MVCFKSRKLNFFSAEGQKIRLAFLVLAAPPTYDQAVGRLETAQEARENDDIGNDFEKIALS